MAVKLSVTGKLDGIKSWALPALTTCPGAYDKTGVLDVCKACYALAGRYPTGAVKRVREHNREDWKQPHWTFEMIGRLEPERYFRWFDSGDIYHPGLAFKILNVIRNTPWCRHWLPTQSYTVPRIRPILEQIAALPNACVRYSSDRFNEYTPGLHGSVIITGATPKGVTLCRAYERTPASCNGCRACWDKTVAVIGYPVHGRTARRIAKVSATPTATRTVKWPQPTTTTRSEVTLSSSLITTPAVAASPTPPKP